MSTLEAVLKATNQRDAILELAAALDRIEEKLDHPLVEVKAADGWGDSHSSWEVAPPAAEPESSEPHVEIGEDHTDVILKPPSAEKQEARRLLAKQVLHLNTALHDVDPEYDWDEAYVAGGPLWLYHGNRELLMSYDYEVRQRMVADVLEDSPEQAHLMSIDILKQPAGEPDFENGAGALAVGWVTGQKR